MLAVLVAGCGASTDDDTFAYDADAPLALETGAQLADGRPLDVREISFESRGGQVAGVLVAPPASEGRRLPAVVYLPGSGGVASPEGSVRVSATAPRAASHEASGSIWVRSPPEPWR